MIKSSSEKSCVLAILEDLQYEDTFIFWEIIDEVRRHIIGTAHQKQREISFSMRILIAMIDSGLVCVLDEVSGEILNRSEAKQEVLNRKNWDWDIQPNNHLRIDITDMGIEKLQNRSV